MSLWLIAAIVIITLCVLFTLLLLKKSKYEGGSAHHLKASKQKINANKHIVVDALNLTHWIHPEKVSSWSIVDTIDRTSPILRQNYKGRVMYIVKDRESILNDPYVRIAFSEAAKRNSVYIYVVERYGSEESNTQITKKSQHSSKGRDDFYMAIMAHKWKCPVLTEDKFKDFDEFRNSIEPFHVYEFAYWRTLPEQDFIRPSNIAYKSIKKPYTISYTKYFNKLKLKMNT